MIAFSSGSFSTSAFSAGAFAFDTQAQTGAGRFRKFQVQTKRGIVEVDTLEEAHFVIRSARAESVAPVKVSLEGIKVKVPSRANVDYRAIEARMRAEINAELEDEDMILLLM